MSCLLLDLARSELVRLCLVYTRGSVLASSRFCLVCTVGPWPHKLCDRLARYEAKPKELIQT